MRKATVNLTRGGLTENALAARTAEKTASVFIEFAKLFSCINDSNMKILTLLVASLLACGVAAHEPVVFDQVDLNTEAHKEVPSELLVATHYVEHEAQRQAEVSALAKACK